MEFSKDQKEAISLFKDWWWRTDDPHFTLSGIAGSGKTSLTKHLIDICKMTVKIPQASGVVGIFIVDYAGCPLYSKVMGIRKDIQEGEVQIGGFISALFSFSQFVIGKESGGKLREINFGNQSFYTITEKKCIIAYLIERMSPLLKRYMYIIAEEFIGRYGKKLEQFDGDIAQFAQFEEIASEYLII